MSQNGYSDTYALLLYDMIGWNNVEESEMQVGFSKFVVQSVTYRVLFLLPVLLSGLCR